MMSRSLRRTLARGAGAAAVAALTATGAFAATGAGDVRADDDQAAAEARMDDEQAAADVRVDGDTPQGEAPDVEGVQEDGEDGEAGEDEATADTEQQDEDAEAQGDEQRSQTATDVQEVVESTPPEERDREFGGEVSTAASSDAETDEAAETEQSEDHGARGDASAEVRQDG